MQEREAAMIELRKGRWLLSSQLKVWLLLVGWVAFVTVMHLWLNTKVLDPGSWGQERAQQQFRVGFLPVT